MRISRHTLNKNVKDLYIEPSSSSPKEDNSIPVHQGEYTMLNLKPIL